MSKTLGFCLVIAFVSGLLGPIRSAEGASNGVIVADVYGEPELEAEARAVTLLLRSMLSTGREPALPRARFASALAEVTGQTRRARLVVGWRIVTKVLEQAGAEYLASSSLDREGTRLVLTIRIANVKGDTLAVVSSRAAHGDITGLVAESARRVAKTINGDVAEHFTGSLGDLEAYGIAMRELNLGNRYAAASALLTADSRAGRRVLQAQLTAMELVKDTELPVEMRFIAAYATGDPKVVEELANQFLAANPSNRLANAAMAWTLVMRRNLEEARSTLVKIKADRGPFATLSRAYYFHVAGQTAARDTSLVLLLGKNPYLPALRWCSTLPPGVLSPGIEARLVAIADRLQNVMPGLSTDLALRAAVGGILRDRALGLIDIASLDIADLQEVLPLLDGRVIALSQARAAKANMDGGVEASLELAWAPAVVMKSEALVRMEKMGEAAARLDEATGAAKPADAPPEGGHDGLMLQGRVLMEQGRTQEAAVAFEKAARVADGQPAEADANSGKQTADPKLTGTTGQGGPVDNAESAGHESFNEIMQHRNAEGVLVLPTGQVNMGAEEKEAMEGLEMVTDKEGIEAEKAAAFKTVGLDPRERAGEAEKQYQKAVEKEMGTVKSGDKEEDERTVEQGPPTAERPKNEAKREEARAVKGSGDFKGAYKILAGLGDAPDSAESHVVMANTLMEQGKPELAVNRLEHAATVAPDQPEVYENLAKAYDATGNAKEAARCREMAASLREGRASSAPADKLKNFGGEGAKDPEKKDRIPPPAPTDPGILALVEKLTPVAAKQLKPLLGPVDAPLLIVELPAKESIWALKYTNPEAVGIALKYLLAIKPFEATTSVVRTKLHSMTPQELFELAKKSKATRVITYTVLVDDDEALIKLQAINFATKETASASLSVPGDLADLVERRIWHTVVGGVCALAFLFIFGGLAIASVVRLGDLKVTVELGPDIQEDVFMLKVSKFKRPPRVGKIDAWSDRHTKEGRKVLRRSRTAVNKVNEFEGLGAGKWYVHLVGTYIREEKRYELKGDYTKRVIIRKNEMTEVRLVPSAELARYRVIVRKSGKAVIEAKVTLDKDKASTQMTDAEGRAVFDVGDGAHTFTIESTEGNVTLPVKVTPATHGIYRLEHDFAPVAKSTGKMEGITIAKMKS